MKSTQSIESRLSSRSSDKVIEEIEATDQEMERKSERTNEEDYEDAGPRSFDPEENLANHELPKWCRYPGPIPFDLQEEADAKILGKVHQDSWADMLFDVCVR